MAVPTKNLDFITSVKKRLDLLECPYTMDMSESAVTELILSPGESRLKVLEWLFSRYDDRLEELLNTAQVSFGTRTESRLQKLLTAASSMCLCQNDDIDVIKGEGSLSRQVNFIDKLLDLVCIREKSHSTNLNSSHSSSSYIDVLANQNGFMNMFEAKLDLLPRDIQAEIESTWIKGGWIRSIPPPQPVLQDLVTKSEKLEKELSKNTLVLEDLQKKVTFGELGKENELLSQTFILATVLKELQQLAEGFIFCFESQINQWCNQAYPELNELGPIIQTVQTSLSKFLKLLEDLSKLQQVQARLNKTLDTKCDVQSQALVQASRVVSETFQHCLSVLEESLHRSKAGFSSKYKPVLSS